MWDNFILYLFVLIAICAAVVYFSSGFYAFLIILSFFFLLFLGHRYQRYILKKALYQIDTINEELKLPEYIIKRRYRSWNPLTIYFPEFEGHYLNRYLRIHFPILPNKKEHKNRHIKIELDIVNWGNTLRIEPAAFWERIKKQILRKKSYTKDNLFNALFQIKGSGSMPYMIFDEKIRQLMIEDVFEEMGVLEINQGLIHYTEEGIPIRDYEGKRIQQVIVLMYMLAHQYDKVREKQTLKNYSYDQQDSSLRRVHKRKEKGKGKGLDSESTSEEKEPRERKRDKLLKEPAKRLKGKASNWIKEIRKSADTKDKKEQQDINPDEGEQV